MPPHGRRIHKQKRPLTGGAFLLFSENFQPLMTARILAMASARFSQPSFK